MDRIILGILGALALAAFAALPAGLAGNVAAGLAVAAAVALGTAVVARQAGLERGGARPMRFDDGALDPVWAAIALAALLFVLLSDASMPDGKAILLVGGITAIGSWLAYRRRLDDRRRAVAVALAAEIRVNAEVTYYSLAPELLAALSAKPDGFKPFAVPVPPAYPVYVGNQEALGLLPPAVVGAVVRFYEVDESMTQAYNALGLDAFHALERDRQNQLYAHIGERMANDYLPTTCRALEGLMAVVGGPADLPDFLAPAAGGRR
ncbi:hypothetical protein [Elioraea sp.]|uniref:hypothetical protein n=1 Tax=Elioraea sp. TaxID=2185103 RepID=UPI0025C2FFEB|nr:hypothetical protein [Elioraea sp.]